MQGKLRRACLNRFKIISHTCWPGFNKEDISWNLYVYFLANALNLQTCWLEGVGDSWSWAGEERLHHHHPPPPSPIQMAYMQHTAREWSGKTPLLLPFRHRVSSPPLPGILWALWGRVSPSSCIVIGKALKLKGLWLVGWLGIFSKLSKWPLEKRQLNVIIEEKCDSQVFLSLLLCLMTSTRAQKGQAMQPPDNKILWNLFDSKLQAYQRLSFLFIPEFVGPLRGSHRQFWLNMRTSSLCMCTKH